MISVRPGVFLLSSLLPMSKDMPFVLLPDVVRSSWSGVSCADLVLLRGVPTASRSHRLRVAQTWNASVVKQF